MDHFAYTGTWEHVSARGDGRFDGTSSRSHRTGDTIVFPFEGSIVRLYGVRGPNGGQAGVAIDGRYYGTADFFAKTKQAHAVVFQSPPLTQGPHAVGILVQGDISGSHRAYVNIDSAEVLPAQ